MRKKFIFKPCYDEQQHMLPSMVKEEFLRWFDFFKVYCIQRSIKKVYEIGNIIGKGTFSKVYEVA